MEDAWVVTASRDASPNVLPRRIARRDEDHAARDAAEAASSLEIEAAIKIQKAARLRQERIARGEVRRRIPGEAVGTRPSFADVTKAVAVAEKLKLAERISRSEAAQLFREKNWLFLRKHIEYHSIKTAAEVEHTAEVETRDRHSLVSLTNPNEVDEEDERHLRDEQARPSPSPSHHTPSSLRPNLDLTRSPNPKPHLTRTLTLRLTLTPSLTQVSQIFFNCLVTELF